MSVFPGKHKFTVYIRAITSDKLITCDALLEFKQYIDSQYLNAALISVNTAVHNELCFDFWYLRYILQFFKDIF